jgi:hypothetical protein
MKKVKSTQIILEKKTKKKHVGKHCSNPQCFKEKNYKTKFSTNSILKKQIDKDNSEKKKTRKKTILETNKKRKKKHVGKAKVKFSISLILKK